MSKPVEIQISGRVAVLKVSNPPVNSLSHAVRLGLQKSVKQAEEDLSVKAIVIFCDGNTFIAGADIREFGKPPIKPYLPELINVIEAASKPIVIALHGTALGGGLELALGGHYRVALGSTQFGFPEVKLGLLPGAGGTQRLPRLIPVTNALNMITSGAMISARESFDLGLIDEIAEGEDIRSAGIAFAKKLIKDGKTSRPTSANACNPAEESYLKEARAKVAKSARGLIAPLKCVDAIEAALTLPFEEGLAKERALFEELMDSDQSAAMIHAFFGERQVAKLSEIEGIEPRKINTVGVVGGGTMGAGIAGSALLAGLDVTLAERNSLAAARAGDTVRKLLTMSVRRGKLSHDDFDRIMSEAFHITTDYADFGQVDLVIEAVFESMNVKKEVFQKLDAVCKPGAILASNTSYLDVNEIGAMTSRPQDVIGLHFFSPAHVMKLLEIVVAEKTAPDTVATGFALAKRLKKVAVRAGVCDGFIGNRILSRYRSALDGAVIAGASPFEIDRVLESFGLAMGPFAVSDLAGLDIGWAARKRLAPTRDPLEYVAQFTDRICELGRFGRKTGRGFYIYDEGALAGIPDPEVEEFVAAERIKKGITTRELSDQEIVDRYMAAMINEAARVVDEGIAERPLDVDVTLLNGYGFPRWRGGPMHYADTVGLDKILTDIQKFQQEDDWFWQPAPLIERLVDKGRNFSSLNK